MYSYLIKGATVGQLLTRRVLRTVTGLPGLLLDSAVAVFWLPNYSNYWQDSKIYYMDDTPVSLFQGVTGWLGDILGFMIGNVVGFIAGAAVFIVDTVLTTCQALIMGLFHYIDQFTQFISHIRGFCLIEKPTSFMEKAWDLGAACIGGLLAVVPYLAIKSLEFCLPFMGNYLSYAVTHLAGIIGGLTGSIIGVTIYPIKYAIEKTLELYDIIRDKVQTNVAILYAKTGKEPISANELSWPDNYNESLHSNQFRDKVTYFKRSSWASLLFGTATNDYVGRQPTQVTYHSEHSDNACTDPITLEPLGTGGRNVLVDNHGHSFNDYGAHNGIRFWVNQNHTCPISRGRLSADDLQPNIAFNDFLRGQGRG